MVAARGSPHAGQRRNPAPSESAFAHQALFYAGTDDLVSSLHPFVLEGVECGEAVMVAVAPPKIAALRDDLGPAAGEVCWVDMDQLSLNPARIIGAWDDFLAERAPAGSPARGVGEPVSPGRTAAALLELQHLEVLLNDAYAGRPAFRLVCPYDLAGLPAGALEEAARSHPLIVSGAGAVSASAGYWPGDPPGFEAPLPEPAGAAEELSFQDGELGSVRQFVSAAALIRGLGTDRLTELLLVANELATNSICHGGGRGVVRVWRDGGAMVCEVRDAGHIAQPLAGRRPPDGSSERGRGLWMVNQLCDLVQLRSGRRGTVVRAHLRI